MASKELRYEEFIRFAQENYYKGGDVYVECWEEKQFEEYVGKFGPVTVSRAEKMFRENYDAEKERIARMRDCF